MGYAAELLLGLTFVSMPCNVRRGTYSTGASVLCLFSPVATFSIA